MRRDITQKDYIPSFILLDFDKKEHYIQPLPISTTITTSHTQNKKSCDYDAFIDGIQTSNGQIQSFASNLEAYYRKHETTNNIKNRITKALEI